MMAREDRDANSVQYSRSSQRSSGIPRPSSGTSRRATSIYENFAPCWRVSALSDPEKAQQPHPSRLLEARSEASSSSDRTKSLLPPPKPVLTSSNVYDAEGDVSVLGGDTCHINDRLTMPNMTLAATSRQRNVPSYSLMRTVQPSSLRSSTCDDFLSARPGSKVQMTRFDVRRTDPIISGVSHDRLRPKSPYPFLADRTASPKSDEILGSIDRKSANVTKLSNHRAALGTDDDPRCVSETYLFTSVLTFLRYSSLSLCNIG